LGDPIENEADAVVLVGRWGGAAAPHKLTHPNQLPNAAHDTKRTPSLLANHGEKAKSSAKKASNSKSMSARSGSHRAIA